MASKRTIQIYHPETEAILTVTRESYIEAKTLALRQFGYADLKKETVALQLKKVLKGDRHLDVIGNFIKPDIVPDQESDATISKDNS